MILTAVLIPAPEGGFTALNPETGTTTQVNLSRRRLRTCAKPLSFIWKSFRLPRLASRW
jgi:hypothetical protein